MLAAGALEHLVLAGVGIGGQVPDVRNVHDALDVVAAVAEILLQHVLHDIAAQVADVGKVVDRRAAGVHFEDVGMVGREELFFAGQRVVQVHGFFLRIVGRTENPPPDRSRGGQSSRFHSDFYLWR